MQTTPLCFILIRVFFSLRNTVIKATLLSDTLAKVPLATANKDITQSPFPQNAEVFQEEHSWLCRKLP